MKLEFGIECFLDEDDLWQEQFKVQIKNAIRNSKGVIFVATEASLDFGGDANFAALEREWALESRIPIFYCKFDDRPMPKVLEGTKFFDLRGLALDGENIEWLRDNIFRMAMAAIGDALLPAAQQGRGGYKALAAIKCLPNDVDRAAEMLKWANSHFEYPHATATIDEAQRLFQLSWSDAQKKEDYFRMKGADQDALYLKVVEERDDLEKKIHKLSADNKILQTGVAKNAAAVLTIAQGNKNLTAEIGRKSVTIEQAQAYIDKWSPAVDAISNAFGDIESEAILAKLNVALERSKMPSEAPRSNKLNYFLGALTALSLFVAFDSALGLGVREFAATFLN